MKIKFAFILFLVFYLFSARNVSAAYSPSVDVYRLTYGFYREDWPVIHKNIVLWIDSRDGGTVYAYDMREQKEFPFFPMGLPLQNLYGLAGYDGRYLVYHSLSELKSFDVRAYDVQKGKDFAITDEIGSQGASDFDGNTILYLDYKDSSQGKLYAYNIHNGEKTFIIENAFGPKVFGRYVVWYFNVNYPLTDIKVYDLSTRQLINIPNPDNGGRGTPDIYMDKIVYGYIKNNIASIRLYDLSKGEETILLNNIESYSITYPVISRDYAIWGKSTDQHVAGVEGVNLKTGEIFEIQEQGSHQNGVIAPTIEGNIAAWMAWRTGNGDIYAATFSKN